MQNENRFLKSESEKYQKEWEEAKKIEKKKTIENSILSNEIKTLTDSLTKLQENTKNIFKDNILKKKEEVTSL